MFSQLGGLSYLTSLVGARSQRGSVQLCLIMGVAIVGLGFCSCRSNRVRVAAPSLRLDVERVDRNLSDVRLRVTNVSDSRSIRLPANGDRLICLVEQNGQVWELIPPVEGCLFHNDVVVVMPGGSIEAVVSPLADSGIRYRLGVHPYVADGGGREFVWSAWVE